MRSLLAALSVLAVAWSGAAVLLGYDSWRPRNTAPARVDFLRDVSGSVARYDADIREALARLTGGVAVGDTVRLWAIGPEPQLLYERRIRTEADREALRSASLGLQLSGRQHTAFYQALRDVLVGQTSEGRPHWIIVLSDAYPDPPTDVVNSMPNAAPGTRISALFFANDRDAARVWGQLAETGAALEVYSPAESLNAATRIAKRLKARVKPGRIWPAMVLWASGLTVIWLPVLFMVARQRAHAAAGTRQRMDFAIEVSYEGQRCVRTVQSVYPGRVVTLGRGPLYEVDVPGADGQSLRLEVTGPGELALRATSDLPPLVNGESIGSRRAAQLAAGDVITLRPDGPTLVPRLRKGSQD